MSQIIPASLTHLKQIMYLIKACIVDMQTQGIDQWFENYPTVDIFTADIKSGSLYVLQDDQGNCSGIVTLNENQEPEYQQLIWQDVGGRVLVIHRLAVNPEFQKQGIGRQLLNFAENFAVVNGYTSIRLDAYSGNPRALNLYERRGYQKVGQLFFNQRQFPFYCYEKTVE